MIGVSALATVADVCIVYTDNLLENSMWQFKKQPIILMACCAKISDTGPRP